jgi:hypothetical protein
VRRRLVETYHGKSTPRLATHIDNTVAVWGVEGASNLNDPISVRVEPRGLEVKEDPELALCRLTRAYFGPRVEAVGLQCDADLGGWAHPVGREIHVPACNLSGVRRLGF